MTLALFPRTTPSSPNLVPAAPTNGARLVATDGRVLPLRGATLQADAKGGVARVLLEQRFANPHDIPLAVTYSLPLPADGAVSAFSFRIGDQRIVGEIRGRDDARARYEQALVEGKSAALLEQDRSSLFTQEIGNIPPGAEIVAEIVIDQRLAWLDEGAWEWRFPTVVAPRFLGEEGRVPDAARLTQDVADGPLPARLGLTLLVHDKLAEGKTPESPSHALDISGDPKQGLVVNLRARAGVRLDRDLVVRIPVATPKVGLSLDTSRRPGDLAQTAHGLLTIVPPAASPALRPMPRDLVVLLDTSGSMDGEPLDQARRVVSALIDTLRDDDQLELIEFSSAPRRWQNQPVRATTSAKREALAWLRALRASGSTEMRAGILEALHTLRPDAQRQVVLVTDGHIGFETEVLRAIFDNLPASSRLHTVGVGSAVNRSLTAPAARAGRGLEVVLGLGEDPERAAARLVARTTAPVLVNLDISGSALVEHAPLRLPDLFAAAPVLVALALRPEGGSLLVRGQTRDGTWEKRLDVPAIDGDEDGPATALFGREKVEDLELALARGGARHTIDAAIEQIGLDYKIATRLTSWLAVSQDVTVDPDDARFRERMPHELPHGMSAEGLGLRPAQAPVAGPKQAASKPKIDLKARLGKTTPMAERTATAGPLVKPSAIAAPSAAPRGLPPAPSAAPRATPPSPQSPLMPVPSLSVDADLAAPKKHASRRALVLLVLVLLALLAGLLYALREPAAPPAAPGRQGLLPAPVSTIAPA
ncbi:VIT and VWA domain-containing protein [Polyangium sp. 6x1]|uniref:VIT and vWA domain-containing protein n=1 Tax=Polyangium sp. 6x1 TaxID=3042689 RepID=UPI0024825C58|nr:VIT and VWA domain-containing protein [Polyangium sp. 6x1]MDI1445723.1 VIT and VWA domain-containing protein [Polyangium sp. 6x1]